MNVATDPRMAGLVERYHTWPTLTTQSVAEHSWQVTRLILAIYPGASRELLLVALFHDIGEAATGDVPSYAKLESPEIARAMDKLEQSAHRRMVLSWNLPAPRQLTEFELWVIHLADVLERWEWALQEQMMGNQFARIVEQRAIDRIDQLVQSANLVGPYYDVHETLHMYMRRRVTTWKR